MRSIWTAATAIARHPQLTESSYIVKFSLSTIVFIVFVILKLTDTVAWSWWWIASPLWISFGLWLLALFTVGFIGAVVKTLQESTGRRARDAQRGHLAKFRAEQRRDYR